MLGRANPTLPRAGWTATADSQETARENARAGNVLDGNAATIWHTQWSTHSGRAAAAHAHRRHEDAHVPVGGLTYLPRPPASANGRIGRYTIETSTNGTTWSARVAERHFAGQPGAADGGRSRPPPPGTCG